MCDTLSRLPEVLTSMTILFDNFEKIFRHDQFIPNIIFMENISHVMRWFVKLEMNNVQKEDRLKLNWPMGRKMIHFQIDVVRWNRWRLFRVRNCSQQKEMFQCLNDVRFEKDLCKCGRTINGKNLCSINWRKQFHLIESSTRYQESNAWAQLISFHRLQNEILYQWMLFMFVVVKRNVLCDTLYFIDLIRVFHEESMHKVSVSGRQIEKGFDHFWW
jgi:hypothetical protein